MKKTMSVLTLFLLLTLMIAQTAPAGLINYDRRNKRSGQTPAQTQSQSKTVTSSTATTSTYGTKGGGLEVNNSYEQKFDLSRDGKLEPSEIRAMLNAVVKEVGTNGEAMVESEAVKPYDRNGDGMITSDELSKLLRDLGN